VSLGMALCLLASAALCGVDAGGLAVPTPHADAMRHWEAAPRWCGPLIAAAGSIPLFYGWRLIRWSMALAAAGVASGAVLSLTLPVWDASLAWTAACASAIICGVLGFFLYQALIAIQLAICLGLILSTLVLWCIPHFTTGALAMGAVGALVGGIIGWRIAPLLGIFETVVYGVLLVIEGMAILIRVDSDGELLLLAGVVAVVTVIPGVLVQLRAHRREE